MDQQNKTNEFLKIVQTNKEPSQIEKIIEEIIQHPLIYNFYSFLIHPNVVQVK